MELIQLYSFLRTVHTLLRKRTISSSEVLQSWVLCWTPATGKDAKVTCHVFLLGLWSWPLCSVTGQPRLLKRTSDCSDLVARDQCSAGKEVCVSYHTCCCICPSPSHLTAPQIPKDGCILRDFLLFYTMSGSIPALAQEKMFLKVSLRCIYISQILGLVGSLCKVALTQTSLSVATSQESYLPPSSWLHLGMINNNLQITPHIFCLLLGLAATKVSPHTWDLSTREAFCLP